MDGTLTGLDMVVDRCPRHRFVGQVMKCPHCSRRLWEHLNAIGHAEKRGTLPPLPTKTVIL